MPKYDFQTVVVPDATDGTWLGGINNAGEATGYNAGFGFDHYPHAFAYANGTFTPLPISMSEGNAINTAGQVAGRMGAAPQPTTGFLWSPDGSVQRITSYPGDFQPSERIAIAYGVNDADQVVGANFYQQHDAFVWQSGTLTQFSVPGASATEAHGINNSGVIVGTADNYGFIDFGGPIALLGIAGATVVDPMAINDDYVVVGSFNDGTHWHGFIDNAGRLQFIDAPGATDTWLTGINDAGTLVGYSDTGLDTKVSGFIASPQDPSETLVGELYRGAFGRDADAGGLSFWADMLRSGLTPSDFVQDFVGSAEFQSLHGQQSDADYVDSLYVNSLGRHAEPAGQAGWVSVLQSGAGRGDVLAAIALSPEGQQHFAAS